MATVTVELARGLEVGEVRHTLAEVRGATVGDMLDAAEEGERLVRTPDGDFRLLASAELVGVSLLRRQIVRIGEHPGPLTLGEIRRLDAGDMERLQRAAQELEAASLGGARPGEPSGAGGGKSSRRK